MPRKTENGNTMIDDAQLQSQVNNVYWDAQMECAQVMGKAFIRYHHEGGFSLALTALVKDIVKPFDYSSNWLMNLSYSHHMT
ncbi:hypothetical protein AMTR_s00009p00074420, partial [Amborella trichopoda]